MAQFLVIYMKTSSIKGSSSPVQLEYVLALVHSRRINERRAGSLCVRITRIFCDSERKEFEPFQARIEPLGAGVPHESCSHGRNANWNRQE